MSSGMSYYIPGLVFPDVLKACSGFRMSGNTVTVTVTQCHIQEDVNPHTPYTACSQCLGSEMKHKMLNKTVCAKKCLLWS